MPIKSELPSTTKHFGFEYLNNGSIAMFIPENEATQVTGHRTNHIRITSLSQENLGGMIQITSSTVTEPNVVQPHLISDTPLQLTLNDISLIRLGDHSYNSKPLFFIADPGIISIKKIKDGTVVTTPNTYPVDPSNGTWRRVEDGQIAQAKLSAEELMHKHGY